MSDLADKLRRIANQMGEYDTRRPVLREAAAQLERYERMDRQAVYAPSIEAAVPELPAGPLGNATCGLCGFEGARLVVNPYYCPECSERW